MPLYVDVGGSKKGKKGKKVKWPKSRGGRAKSTRRKDLYIYIFIYSSECLYVSRCLSAFERPLPFYLFTPFCF